MAGPLLPASLGTSLTVRPWIPSTSSAALTSSSLNGLMTTNSYTGGLLATRKRPPKGVMSETRPWNSRCQGRVLLELCILGHAVLE